MRPEMAGYRGQVETESRDNSGAHQTRAASEGQHRGETMQLQLFDEYPEQTGDGMHGSPPTTDEAPGGMQEPRT